MENLSIKDSATSERKASMPEISEALRGVQYCGKRFKHMEELIKAQE